MRRDGIDYVECRGCGEVFEAEDLEQVSLYDDADVDTEMGNQAADAEAGKAEQIRQKKAS